MNWLIVIIVIAAIVFIVSKLSGESTEDSAAVAGGAALGCGYILLQIFIAGLSILFLLWIFGALFG